MKKKIIGLFLFLALFLTGCAKNQTQDVFRFETHQLDMLIGEEVSIELIYGSVSKTAEISYVVSDDSIVKFENGKITALKVGTAKITAKVKNSSTTKASVNITVSDISLSSLKINGIDSLLIGESNVFTASVTPSFITNSVTWKSSDPSIATVDQNGKVVAVNAGVVNITATSKYDTTIIAVKKVEVKYHDAQGIEIKFLEGSENIEIGNTAKITATVTPQLANKNYTIVSSDEKVVKVAEDGTITTLKVGEAKLTVTSADGKVSKEVLINVLYPAATDINVNTNEGDYYVNDTFKLVTSVLPENANQEVLISCNVEDGISVKNKVITFLKSGEIIVSIKSADEKVEKKLTFNILPIPVATGITVKLEDDIKELEDGLSCELIINVLPDKALQDFDVTVSNDAVAQIVVRGTTYSVKAVGIGEVTITVTCKENKDISAQVTLKIIPLL